MSPPPLGISFLKCQKRIFKTAWNKLKKDFFFIVLSNMETKRIKFEKWENNWAWEFNGAKILYLKQKKNQTEKGGEKEKMVRENFWAPNKQNLTPYTFFHLSSTLSANRIINKKIFFLTFFHSKKFKKSFFFWHYKRKSASPWNLQKILKFFYFALNFLHVFFWVKKLIPKNP